MTPDFSKMVTQIRAQKFTFPRNRFLKVLQYNSDKNSYEDHPYYEDEREEVELGKCLLPTAHRCI
jgi:hypothetical protein